MDPRISVALAAGFGGVAPNVFRLATKMTAGDGAPEISYLIGMLIFAAMGAAVALAFEERELKKAFFLGLGLPAMFQSGVNDISSAANSAWLVTPAVYASESEQPPREITLRLENVPPFDVIFSAYDGKRKELFTVAEPGKEEKLNAPGWARSFVVVIGSATSEPTKIPPPDEAAFFRVRIKRSAWSGLKQSVGVKGVSSFNVLVTREKEEP